MKNIDDKLLSEAYDEMVEEGVFDRIGAKGASRASRWASKVAGGVGKAMGSEALQKAGEDLGTEAASKEIQFITNKIVRKFIKSVKGELEEAKAVVNKSVADLNKLHDDFANDVAKLNLDEGSPEFQKAEAEFAKYAQMFAQVQDIIEAQLKETPHLDKQAFGQARNEKGQVTKELNPNLNTAGFEQQDTTSPQMSDF